MKGDKKRRVENRQREMKKGGETGCARGRRREMEWSEAREGVFEVDECYGEY